jgi:hypothetical protein
MNQADTVETYLGGFYNPTRLSVGKFTTGSSIGAGVYATDKRLFILGHGKAAFPGGTLKKIVAGSEKGDFVPTNITREQTDNIVRALSENRLYEIGKGQVAQIAVTKPPGFLRTGWLKVTSADGRTLEVKVSGNTEYEWMVRLMQSFKAEVVTTG